jgi:hypothetical protein
VREAITDLWELHSRGVVVAVTTNGLVVPSGVANLGRGTALQASKHYPWLAARLGASLATHGNHVANLGERIVSFPVEHSPLEPADLRLVTRSARELSALADAEGWTEVALGRPGCGGGGLVWADVRKAIAPLLDDRFLVVTLSEPGFG